MERAHTYSIVAFDRATGQLGVAVQSHWFNVGRIVPWARAGVGAVATQSLADPMYGPRGLDLMQAGMSAPATLHRLLADDPAPEVRQVAMVDNAGQVAVHTGGQCIEFASHQTGDGWSVQANIMRNDRVVPALAAAMTESVGPLRTRLLSSLVAAQASGGDLRGSQSAALLIVDSGSPVPLLDLRVEDHPDPIGELSRLVETGTAYDAMNEGDDALAAGDIRTARLAYRRASSIQPDNAEILFWMGLGLAAADDWDPAVKALGEAVDRNRDLMELLRRLPDAGLVDKELGARLLDYLDS